MSALVKSGVLDMVTDQLNKFTASIDAEGVKNISDKLVSGIKKIKEEFEELGFKGLWDKYVGAALEKAGGSIGKWIKELIFGKSEEDLTKQQDLIDKLTEQRDILKKGGAEAEAYSQKIGKDLGQVEAELAAAKTSYEEDKNKKGFLQKIMDDIFSFENIVKTLAIGGGIYVAIKGFSVLLALFGAGKVALGAAVLVGLFVGTGYAIKLAGEGINLAGEGLERVSAAMKDLSTIKDTDNLSSVAGIMGEMADSLTKFAIGGVIARMIGSDTLKNLADSISYFDTIDATKLKDVGPGIAALYEGTSKFTGDGAWEGFSKWVGSLFGGSSNDFEKMAKGIKHFETIDGMKLANLGAGLSGIAEFVAQINAETELKGQVEAIEKLIVAMKDYQEQYNDMSSDMQSNFSMAVSNSGKESVEALNQLNTVLQALLIETQTSNQIGKQIVGAVDNQGTIG